MNHNEHYLPMTNAKQLADQALTEHLRDLRSCLVKSFAAVVVGFVICYVFIEPIGHYFFKPLLEVMPDNSSLIFSAYQEGFFFI